jgi:hypothetical protein
MVMVSQAGWRVERVTVNPRPAGEPYEVFRVSWKGYWQADCATTVEVARYVDLTTLVPTGWAHVQSPEYLAGVAKANARRGRRQLQERTGRAPSGRWLDRG